MDQANIDFGRLRTILEAARTQRDRCARLSRTCDLRRRQFNDANSRLERERDGLRGRRDQDDLVAPFVRDVAQARRLLDLAFEERDGAAAERPEVGRLATSCAEFVLDLMGDRTPIDIQEFLGVA